MGHGRITKDEDYLPWVRAKNMQDCELFWLSVPCFPIPYEQRQWLFEFQTRLAEAFTQQLKLRTEIFMQYKSITGPMVQEFIKYRQRCFTTSGMCRRPGASIPTLPTAEQLREAFKKGDTMDPKTWVADYSYWFLGKQPEIQRELFGGHGGMTTVVLPLSTAAAMPNFPFTPALRAAHPAFKKFDIDGMLNAAAAHDDPFLLKSKKLFGAGLEDKAQYGGIAFILPLLETGHFFAVTPEIRAQWFDLFHLYLHESVEDKGVVMAFSNDYTELLLNILQSMSKDGLVYEKQRLF